MQSRLRPVRVFSRVFWCGLFFKDQPTDNRTSARESSIPAAVNEYLPSSRKQLKPASDNATDGAITLLEGHQSEVGKWIFYIF